MNLQTIIKQFESETLPSQPDPYLEKARLLVESAANQARHLPGLVQFRQTLFAIESTITKTLTIRYGCND
ncbi:hypothetical protein GCM10028803_04920 [Larkinella knui]|uniref:Uncharacterized protein n=1 Tax=Larkinella knui TaxID=2025310 RepID=A0A3P1CKV1_9BACT|nr:hypothetical protein [Larkinella knui]RRB13830.1 hypothetical protein EHT87_16355 [Larkinella knui]